MGGLQVTVDSKAAFDICFNLGFVCVRMSMLGMAQHYYTRAVEINPHHSDAWRGLAGAGCRQSFHHSHPSHRLGTA